MKFIKRFRKRRYWLTGIIILVIIGIFIARSGSSAPTMETATVSVGNILEQVSVTGKVSPIEKADLAFEKSGAIDKIYVKVGDVVVSGQALAVLDSSVDSANLASAQAKLDDLTRKLRPEEYQAEKSKVDAAQVAVFNAKVNAVNAMRDGYVKAQSAIVNYADVLFTNPQSANPVIKVVTQSQTMTNSINSERVTVTDILSKWKNDIGKITLSDDINDYLVKVDKYLSGIKIFMNDLTSIVNYLNTGNSGLTQSVLDTYVTDVNSAQATLNQAITAVSGAETTLESTTAASVEAESNFALKDAGSSPDAIRAQRATVDGFRATLVKDTLYSPISGLITKVVPNEGEFVSAGTPVFSVQSYGDYKIEAYVPEADIAKVALNNKASVTLDAYGSETLFPATVSAIDPAETILEGVPTYKVTLHFDNKDTRIRSGMTANTDILTHERDNVLIVPSRSVIDDVGKKSIRVLNADGKTYTSVPVTVGLRGYNGFTEIVSGLKDGDKIVTYVK